MTGVLVVARVRVHRESLSVVLNDTPGLSVVGTAATAAQALPRLKDLGAEVAVIDAREPEDIDLSPTATPGSEVRLVAVGVPDEEAMDWIEAGVSGYVAPEASLNDLAAAVANVARGDIVTTPKLQARLLARIRTSAAGAPAEDGLTPRQKEVLHLVAEGLSNKQVAQRLSIQEQTVKNHVQKVLRALGVHRRGEAAAWLRRQDRPLR